MNLSIKAGLRRMGPKIARRASPNRHDNPASPGWPLRTVEVLLIVVLIGLCPGPAAPRPYGAGGTSPPLITIAPGETSVTRTTDLTSGESLLSKTVITLPAEGDSAVYIARRSGEKGTTLTYLSRHDLRPLRHQVVGDDGHIERQVDFEEDIVRIAVSGDTDTLLIETSGPSHTGSTLIHYLRTFAAGRGPDRLETKLLAYRGEGKYRVVDVFARRAGIERVSVPAGEFRCVKIEFGVAGIIGRLFWRTRYHYFYTAAPPHHFVKYIDPDGECIELVEYKCAAGGMDGGDD